MARRVGFDSRWAVKLDNRDGEDILDFIRGMLGS